MLVAGMEPDPAAAGDPTSEIVRAEVLPGWRTRDGTRMAALHLTLAPGWKTYWRAPGDAGIPPAFDWSGSGNLAGVTIHWPTPHVFETAGLRTVGYKGDVVLPMEFRPREAGQPMRVSGRVDLGVCETICMPASLRFDAVLEGAGASDGAIQAALADRPVPGSKAGVGAVSCSFRPIEDGLRLKASIEIPKLGDEVAIVEAGDPEVWVSEAEVARNGRRLDVEADLVPPFGRGLVVDRSALRFTVIGRSQAVDIRGCTD